jgi:hypothetical protein
MFRKWPVFKIFLSKERFTKTFQDFSLKSEYEAKVVNNVRITMAIETVSYFLSLYFHCLSFFLFSLFSHCSYLFFLSRLEFLTFLSIFFFYSLIFTHFSLRSNSLHTGAFVHRAKALYQNSFLCFCQPWERPACLLFGSQFGAFIYKNDTSKPMRELR